MKNIYQKEESTDCRMMASIEQMDHPWHALATVTTFDRGNMKSTLCLNNTSENQTNRQIAQVTPLTSVLIESLIEQLCAMFEMDKVRRNKLYFAICDKLHELKLIDNSYNMMEFEPLRGQYQRALYHLVTIARAATETENTLRTPSSLMSEWSRYHREFHEIEFIASGGFGKVFRALHRLDGIEYAIKQIVVHSSRVEAIMQHLREVKTLAKLNHENIVSYKAAWIEPTLLSSFVSSTSTDHKLHGYHMSVHTKESKSENSHSNKDTCNNRSNLNFNDSNKQNILFDNKDSYTTGQRIFERNVLQECEETNSDIVSFRHSNSNVNKDQTENDYTDSSDSYEESSPRELCTYTSDRNQQYMTLYIQMALCEQTLKQWMNRRINITSQPIIIAIFQQILRGLDYIHSQNVIHHDIKPSNIFISTSGQLQIHLGDFGLACPLQKETHHSVIGTHMYAAPEQLQGKCDRKSDIYSVGIVLTELLIPTQTQMELSSIISCLKCGNIPEALTVEQHKWAQLIMQLIQEDPINRPCTKQLLHDLNNDKDIVIDELRNGLRDKDNTIQELQDEIALLKEEVRKLKVLPENTIK